ncbi:hypothetical protein ASC90_25510 [Rhizobium sp. Root1220]|nr:hypothetical protein ASC90_25510 [Rhizobium sp. Root1220]
MVEVQIVNTALKTLCREFGVERDRNSVLQIATLLVRLSKEGIGDAEELAQSARQQLAAVFASEDSSQERSSSL